MSTRALVGHYTDSGSWRAAWVHWGGAPEELGASLVRAVELSGGDPRPVLAHVLSTNGWSSWPDAPHHPADPDDAVITPETASEDVDWWYLFAIPERRLDVIAAAEPAAPRVRVHFGDAGKPDPSLGPSSLVLADLAPVRAYWCRRCREPLAAALGAVLDELEIGGGASGLGADPAANPASREIEVGARVVRIDALPFDAPGAIHAGGAVVPLPAPAEWFEARPALWQSLCDALGLSLEIAGDELVRYRVVVEHVADPGREIALDEARAIDEDFAAGDDYGVPVRKGNLIWRWLFEQGWEGAR